MLVGVSILIFIIARIIPGDPARMALGPTATQEMVEQLQKQLMQLEKGNLLHLVQLQDGLTHLHNHS